MQMKVIKCDQASLDLGVDYSRGRGAKPKPAEQVIFVGVGNLSLGGDAPEWKLEMKHSVRLAQDRRGLRMQGTAALKPARAEIEHPGRHVIITLSPRDRVPAPELAQEWVKTLLPSVGLQDCPWVAHLHLDSGAPHIDLYATCCTRDGRVANEWRNHWNSQEACQKLEVRHSLVLSPCLLYTSPSPRD